MSKAGGRVDLLPKQMRALCLRSEGLRLEDDYPMPAATPGEAIVRVILAGICATDLQLAAGYKGGYRGVLGHEFVGEVVATDREHEEWLGRRVVGELNIGCGHCALCRRGLAKHCRRRESLGIIGRAGAFAEYLRLPVQNLHRVPEEIPDRVAVFVEPLAAALEILEQVHVRPETRAVVVGDGRLGQLIARVLALTGCELTVVGRHEGKLALLGEEGIDTYLVDAGGVDDGSEADLDAAGVPVDVVVEATGKAGGFELARRLVRPSGTLVLKSTFAGGATPVDLSGLVVDEVRLVGSRCGPFPPALRLLASKRVHVEPLITAEYPLELGVAALEHAGQRGTLKVLVRMSSTGG